MWVASFFCNCIKQYINTVTVTVYKAAKTKPKFLHWQDAQVVQSPPAQNRDKTSMCKIQTRLILQDCCNKTLKGRTAEAYH